MPRMAGAPLLIMSVLASAFVLAACSADRAASDQRRVFCLAPAERVPLAAAATALDRAEQVNGGAELIVNKQQMDVATWSHRYPGDFDRTCAALWGASGPSSVRGAGGGSLPAWLGSLLQLLGILLAASLAAFFGARRSVTDHTRARVDALRSAWQEFRRSVEDYAEARARQAPGGVPPLDEIHESRAILRALLRRLADSAKGWSAPRELADRLDREFGVALASGWTADPGAANPADLRDRRRAAVEAELQAWETDLDAVIAAAEGPRRGPARLLRIGR